MNERIVEKLKEIFSSRAPQGTKEVYCRFGEQESLNLNLIGEFKNAYDVITKASELLDEVYRKTTG